ncbi:O-antigen ligase family protein [Chitinophaga alhagiae]|nr:O-antigen ligase family protein [Chitinophaga alhagiae]
MNDFFLKYHNAGLKNVMFAMLFFISLLGYIPMLPYWLYNIGTFITIPIFIFITSNYSNRFVTKNEIAFLGLFVLSLLLSYLTSPFGFTIAGFLRALVPIIFYYLVRVLNVKKTDFYYSVLYYLLILSFLVAAYQFFFQPAYIINDDGAWEEVEGVLTLMKRPVSYLGNSNVFGVFTVFCFLILFTEGNQRLTKNQKVALFIVTILNLTLFSKSRTSLAAFIVTLLIYLFHKRKFIPLLVVFLFFLAGIAYVLSNYEQIEAIDNIFRLSSLSSEDRNSYSIRSEIAKFAIPLIGERPFFGVGVGNEQQLMMSTGAPHKGMESATLLLLIERGILGYLIYLYILFSKFLLVKNNITRILIGLVMISVDFTETVCVIPQLSTFLAIYLGVTWNTVNQTDNKLL